jgi:hypothetical protein
LRKAAFVNLTVHRIVLNDEYFQSPLGMHRSLTPELQIKRHSSAAARGG